MRSVASPPAPTRTAQRSCPTVQPDWSQTRPGHCVGDRAAHRATKIMDIQVGANLSHPEGIALNPRTARAYVAIANEPGRGDRHETHEARQGSLGGAAPGWRRVAGGRGGDAQRSAARRRRGRGGRARRVRPAVRDPTRPDPDRGLPRGRSDDGQAPAVDRRQGIRRRTEPERPEPAVHQRQDPARAAVRC